MAYLNTNKWQKELFKRTEKYAGNVRVIYEKSISEVIDLVKGTQLEEGKPFSFAGYGYGDEADRILRRMYASVYKEIQGDSANEWEFAELNNDELTRSVFGNKALSDNHFARFFGRNKEAMDAFLKRKSGADGLNLSQRVWDYTKQHKTNLEDSLDLAIGEGTPANSLATKITQYLREPDRVYKRFRIRTGTDNQGKPVYGSILKRRTFDKETGLYKWVNESKNAYKPGAGVYRSSYRNAQRLARTETNIAYRTADYERWQNFDFVISIEIKLSNNHPTIDICNELKGIYPKDIKWTGWHSNCRCYMVPVLANQDQIDEMVKRIMAGEDTKGIVEPLKEYPDVFKDWVKNNEERYATAKINGTLPYFIKDNQKAIEKILNPKNVLQKAEERHNARTEEEKNAIRKAWNDRKATRKYGNAILDYMSGIPDVDVSALADALKSGNDVKVLQEAKALKAIGKKILSFDKLDDPMAVAKQYSFAEAESVQNAVESKFQKWADSYGAPDWDSLDLDKKAKKLDYEIQWLPMNHFGKSWERLWEVSQKAYSKEYANVQETIDWNNIKNLASSTANYKTKSNVFNDLASQLQNAINHKDKPLANKLISDLQTKRTELEKAVAKRAAKKGSFIFDPDSYTYDRKNAAIWCKSSNESHMRWDSLSNKIWNSATNDEQSAWYAYTDGSGHMNKPLRGYDGLWGWNNYKGVGKVPLNDLYGEKHIRDLFGLIERNRSTEDIWLQRGIETWDGVEGLFSTKGLTTTQLKGMVGKDVVDYSFMSCGSAKGSGFNGTILNIYCPKGTKMIYASPHSSYMSENETILQMGTKFRITKVEVTPSGEVYVDLEVIGYETHPLL